jgi:hypothetical protein
MESGAFSKVLNKYNLKLSVKLDKLLADQDDFTSTQTHTNIIEEEPLYYAVYNPSIGKTMSVPKISSPCECSIVRRRLSQEY